MKTITKRILLISICMILAGGVLLALGTALGGFPGVSIGSSGISSVSKSSRPYTQEKINIDSFENISILMDSSADIRILPSEDDRFYLEYSLPGDYGKPEYTVTDNVLTFTQENHSNGIFNIGGFGIFVFGSRSTEDDYRLTVYVPEDTAFEHVTVCNSYGDVLIQALTCDELELTLESGDLNIEASSAEILSLSNAYGDVAMKEFSGGTSKIEAESGNVELDHSEIDFLTVTCEYGNVAIKELSCDTADLELDSADLDLDAAKLSKLTCSSEYGNIRLSLPDALDAYTIYAETEYGNIQLPADAPFAYYNSGDDTTVYRVEGTTDKSLKLYAESGDIIFEEQ